jgi:hypothetical protein
LGRYDLAVVATFPDEAIAAAYCLTSNAGGYATEVHVALEPVQLATAQALVDQAFQSSDEPPPPVDAPELQGDV